PVQESTGDGHHHGHDGQAGDGESTQHVASTTGGHRRCQSVTPANRSDSTPVSGSTGPCAPRARRKCSCPQMACPTLSDNAKNGPFTSIWVAWARMAATLASRGWV